jgi:hypothetical protein
MDGEICRVKVKILPPLDVKQCSERLYSSKLIDYYHVLMYEDRIVDMQLKPDNLNKLLDHDHIKLVGDAHYFKL